MLNNLFKNNKKTANLNLAINEKTREQSRGRSMVEMLGVLAIIGVLSIGGISGYTIAMRRYRANEIVNLLTKYADVVYFEFYNYMLNNPDDVEATRWGYSCKNQTYCIDTNKSFVDRGLGALPVGLESVISYYIWPPTEKYSVDRVDVNMFFSDKELCKTVASLLSGYYSDVQDDADGNECDSGSLIKAFPVE